ncbi:MAG: outer membrane beta-barrel protein [Rickettsiaceae bacterium]|nr:outer membrane beta-barrel protein [Rickettsiaceae bacterium]
MNKLLTAVAAATLATSSFANEGTFYLRADAGLSYLPKQTLKFKDINDEDLIVNSKVKTQTKIKNNIVGALGVGYYLTDNIRSELVLSNHFGTTQKGTQSLEVGGFQKITSTIAVTPTITSITLKGLVDAYDFGAGKFFVGAGLGMSQVSAKAKYKTEEEIKVLGIKFNSTEEGSFKWKKQNNFSYLLTTGASFNVSDTVKFDVAYTYANYGKLNKIKDEEGESFKCNYNLASHNVTAGIRVSL